MARTSPITIGTDTPEFGSRGSGFGRRGSALAFVAIAAVFAAGWFLVGAAANVPVIDDWVYAWSVEDLLATRRLHMLPFSAIYPVAQLLWGALFARLFGFSFAALRLSTVVLSAAGCFAVFLTLREMDCRLGTALLGAMAVAFHPVYFAMSFSFMTEVPFIALTSWAFYFSTRAIRRNEAAAFWAAAGFAIAAFLVRPIAIALPLAILPALWWARAWRRGVTPVLTALAAMIVLQIALPRLFTPLEGTDARYNFLKYWFDVAPSSYARWTAEIAIIAAFPMMPLWLAQAATLRRAMAAAIAALALAAVCRWIVGYFVMPLPNWQTWSLQDIGARAMIGGNLETSAWSVRIAPLVIILGLFGTGCLVTILVRAWRKRPLWRGDELFIAAWIALNIGFIHALWFYNDRYYVVFAPAFAIIGARAMDGNRAGKIVTAALLVAWAAIGITGTRDLLAFNSVLAQTARELEASGIPPWEIDAGYALNGWRLYAHPEHLAPSSDRRYAVPFVTSERVTPYSIASSPLPNSEVLRVIPLPRATWQASRELYLLRRHPL